MNPAIVVTVIVAAITIGFVIYTDRVGQKVTQGWLFTISYFLFPAIFIIVAIMLPVIVIWLFRIRFAF